MSNSTTTPSSKAVFAKHKSVAIQNDNNSNNAASGAKMSLVARFLIFIFIPSFTGFTGLGVSYLQQTRPQEEGVKPHVVDFDRDFVTPFLLAMALVVVLGFQTGGFSNGPNNRTAALSWPKTRKVQRVRKERVIVEDEEDKKER
eukprot:CAMPEP_0196131648 /NCGR_PEP_ID=MMETSP0910-20130528/1561_1 /TAXON_ID=49265 /ORGANISM="Thalassiosira rotula, Strain GSO102" /LENGTH=143 /DNA_ID=CAMNT_0041391131 /DNA_START=124 /DNA_END=555 /DNA_ORIENTATION=+